MRSGKILILILGLVYSLFFVGCAKNKQYIEEAQSIEQVDDFETTDEPNIRNRKFEESQKLEKIYFDFDECALTSQAREKVKNNYDWLMENQDCIVVLEGHCDECGTTEYNLALGQKRATIVREYLIYLGIKPNRIATLSYGEEKPFKRESNPAAWALNRRVEFKCSFDKETEQ